MQKEKKKNEICRKINHNTKLFFCLSANKDEIAMKNSAEKRKNKRNKDKEERNRKLQHNHLFCLYE
jgi:hypothetical protein